MINWLNQLSNGGELPMKLTGQTSFVSKLFKTAVSLICILSMMSTVFISSSLADDCGKSDRLPLPRCVKVNSNAMMSDVEAYNFCDHPITIKFDRQTISDKRYALEPNQYVQVGGAPMKLACCPRYNSCADSELSMPSGNPTKIN